MEVNFAHSGVVNGSKDLEVLFPQCLAACRRHVTTIVKANVVYPLGGVVVKDGLIPKVVEHGVDVGCVVSYVKCFLHRNGSCAGWNRYCCLGVTVTNQTGERWKH